MKKVIVRKGITQSYVGSNIPPKISTQTIKPEKQEPYNKNKFLMGAF